MQRPQVDLAVKRRLKRVRVSIRVFYAKYSANSLRASALRVGGGKLPPPAPTPLVGPTTLQILATPLSGGAQMEGGRWALLSGGFGLVHSIIRLKQKITLQLCSYYKNKIYN